MRRLRTAEIIHRFDDALGHYNLKHNTKLTWKESDTGIEEVYATDTTRFGQILSFAEALGREQSDVPKEFNKVFQDNFWDILA